jgi:hypothetical protein
MTPGYQIFWSLFIKKPLVPHSKTAKNIVQNEKSILNLIFSAITSFVEI